MSLREKIVDKLFQMSKVDVAVLEKLKDGRSEKLYLVQCFVLSIIERLTYALALYSIIQLWA